LIRKKPKGEGLGLEEEARAAIKKTKILTWALKGGKKICDEHGRSYSRVSPGRCPSFRQNVLVFLGVSLG
jgi:hypothetical protein